MSRRQVLIPKVLGQSWRFYAALQIVGNQYCARVLPIFPNARPVFLICFSSIHQVNYLSHLDLMRRPLLTTVLAFRRTFPGKVMHGLIPDCSDLYPQAFDRLLLLRKGGQTVYFGDVGEGAQSIISYFENGGARQCKPGENPYV